MAKQIKTIQCPQCGSAQQSKIKEDHYKCGSCGAEYFLDNDDINVNVKYEYQQRTSPAPNKKLANTFTIAAIAIALVVAIVVFLINTRTNSDDILGPSAANINDYIEGASIPPFSHNAISLYITKRTYGYSADNDNRNGYYAIFYDLENKKKLKEIRLDAANIRVSGSAYSSRYFPSMNKTFGIINKSRVLDIDFAQMAIKDVTEEIFKKHKEFDSGTATIEFTYEDRGEGFRVMTNLGQNLTYYPSVDVLLEENKSINEDQNIPQPIEKTFYIFTEKSRDYPNLPIQLLKITYLYNNGGPENRPSYLSWSKDYWNRNANGEYDRYIIRKDNKTVRNFEDFTPNRMYFNPKVLYQTDKELLIKFNPTMAPDAPTSFQLLNLETKEPKWTKQIVKDIYVTNVSLTDKYFIILQHSDQYHFLPLGDGEIESFKMPRR